MTIVVVGVIAVPLALLIGQYIDSVFDSHEYLITMNLARMEMERVYNMPFDRVVSTTFPQYQGYAYELERRVTVVPTTLPVPADSSLKIIKVFVRRPRSAETILGLSTRLTGVLAYGP